MDIGAWFYFDNNPVFIFIYCFLAQIIKWFSKQFFPEPTYIKMNNVTLSF
jgi:hypothetical protein